MDTRGKLATADLWLKGQYDEAAIVAAIENMLKKYTVVNHVAHQFTPHGLTAVWVLSESHCAIHTYPEHNFIAVDLYTCSSKYDPIECLVQLSDALDCKHTQFGGHLRGIRNI